MNHDSEEDMAKDVEENPEIYQALADDGNAYKSMEVDKTGGVDEEFWWSEHGRLDTMKEDTLVMLLFIWAGTILTSIAAYFSNSIWSLIIIWIFLLSVTAGWWMDMKYQQGWVEENEGDWDE